MLFLIFWEHPLLIIFFKVYELDGYSEHSFFESPIVSLFIFLQYSSNLTLILI